jgi:hypothetical protein
MGQQAGALQRPGLMMNPTSIQFVLIGCVETVTLNQKELQRARLRLREIVTNLPGRIEFCD